MIKQIVNLHIEKLPEGVYLATLDEIPSLATQGRTITETLEIAGDVAKKLFEVQTERKDFQKLKDAGELFEYPPVVGG